MASRELSCFGVQCRGTVLICRHHILALHTLAWHQRLAYVESMLFLASMPVPRPCLNVMLTGACVHTTCMGPPCILPLVMARYAFNE